MKHFIQRASLAAALVFLLTGASCGLQSNAPAVVDGGIYKSADLGANWAQKTAIPEIGGRIIGFADAQVNALVIDPMDHNVLYVATADKGLLQSMDGGERWESIPYFGANVRSVAVDYGNKCEYFGLTPNKLSRTTNCGRDFKDVLTETRQGYELMEVISDSYNKNTVYVATTNEILKSVDNGDSWTTLKRFDDNIADVWMDVADSRILMVGLASSGIWQTLDAGKNWIEKIDQLSGFDGASNIISISQSGRAAKNYIISTNHGLLRTTDGGDTWNDIQLLTPANTVQPLAVAVDWANNKNIYYATTTTLYKTVDGGLTWITQKLPTNRLPSTLTIDYKDSRVLYLGTEPVPEQ